MLEIIVIIVVLVGIFLALEIWPRIENKLLFNENFVNSIVTPFNLKKKEDRLFVGKKSDYFLEMLFISPTSNHLRNKPRIRITLNYKPEQGTKKQESKIAELRTKYPEFNWVANCIYTDIRVLKDFPKENDVRFHVESMEQTLRNENLVGTSEKESNRYAEDWDREMMK